MILYLINPYNPLVSVVKTKENRWNRYTVWKPLGLLVLAGLTPPQWVITIFDENCTIPDYENLPIPDLVGITAFTSQANRAYEVAKLFRNRSVPVVMGGIHATMCTDEALERVDSVVSGEAESVWPQVLEDCTKKELKRCYTGIRLNMERVPIARHDLSPRGYFFGSIQISRGCPLSCSFCSVTAFNGGQFRRRPIDSVIKELQIIKEKYILIVDDNLIGTAKEHIAYTKKMLAAMIQSRINKKWIAQVTINMSDDDELLKLARKAGCIGVFIGFESTTAEGIAEVSKKYVIRNGRNMKSSVSRIQHNGIAVLGSFIIGLDSDKKNIGATIAATARQYGLDILNVMVLTPLPGTRLWNKLESEQRIVANNFPLDWKYYTLTFPVSRYKNFTWQELVQERQTSYENFYSFSGILNRLITSSLRRCNPLFVLICNLWYRKNTLCLDQHAYHGFVLNRDILTQSIPVVQLPSQQQNALV
ncbi:MAG: B12-binding domain-containing radical SAM protein [Chitinivibrionales bacterium]|nr:B12-binding domain-containing radical SAM protein [Chitinivibrionales bacterium]